MDRSNQLIEHSSSEHIHGISQQIHNRCKLRNGHYKHSFDYIKQKNRQGRWLNYFGLRRLNADRVGYFTLLVLFSILSLLLYSANQKYSRQQFPTDASEIRFRFRRSPNASSPHDSLCTLEKNNHPTVWIVFLVFVILLTFIGLAIICDDFFVPSLEVMSDKLSLSEDVAGATFMAAGSSAPELFSSVAAAIQGTDVGVGAIVGSASFNMCIIIALTAMLAGSILHLDWKPLARDAVCYSISVGLLIIFAWDGILHWYESLSLVIFYILYIVLMKFNPRLMAALDSCACNQRSCSSSSVDPHVKVESTEMSPTSNSKTPEQSEHRFHHRRNSEILTNVIRPQARPSRTSEQLRSVEESAPTSQMQGNNEEEDGTIPICCCCCCCDCCPRIRTGPPLKSELTDSKDRCCWKYTKYTTRWIIYILAFPFLVLFTLTVPDCSKEKNKKWFWLTFTMSVVWIAGTSYALVTAVEHLGCILGIEAFTMALVVVAAGTSVPDALSSIIVARDGYGDMAVSNALGSNVFDVDLGIGLPMLLRSIIIWGPVNLLDPKEALLFPSVIPITPHVKFSFILLVIVFATVSLLACNKFRLNKIIGACLIGLYLVFLVYSFVQDKVCNLKC